MGHGTRAAPKGLGARRPRRRRRETPQGSRCGCSSLHLVTTYQPEPSHIPRKTERRAREARTGSISVLIDGWAHELAVRLGCRRKVVSSQRATPTRTVSHGSVPFRSSGAASGRSRRGPAHARSTPTEAGAATATVAGHEYRPNAPTTATNTREAATATGDRCSCARRGCRRVFESTGCLRPSATSAPAAANKTPPCTRGSPERMSNSPASARIGTTGRLIIPRRNARARSRPVTLARPPVALLMLDSQYRGTRWRVHSRRGRLGRIDVIVFLDEGLGNGSYLVEVASGRAVLVDPDRRADRYIHA